MSESKFTSGPWVAHPNPMRDDGWFVSTETTKVQLGCTVIRDGKPAPYVVPEKNITFFQINSEANARLIAAAPDLYEALADASFYLKSLGERLAERDLDNTETYGCLKTASMFARYLDAALAKVGAVSAHVTPGKESA